MITNVQNRCPRLCGARFNWGGYDTDKYSNSVLAERVDVRNNFYYNWGNGNGAYGGQGGQHNLVNNYYKAGPGTKNKTRVYQSSTLASDDATKNNLPESLVGRYYISGNYVTAASKPANYDWSGFKQDTGTGVNTSALTYTDTEGLYGTAGATVNIKMDSPVDAGTVTTHTAQNAYTQVMAYAGASLHRDDVDKRYMKDAAAGTTTYKMTENPAYNKNGVLEEVTEFTAGIVDKINDPESATQYDDRPSFPTLTETSRPADFDSDGDGIPDEWESLYGLNPDNASDAQLFTLDSEQQYNNLECYLNSLVEDIMKAENQNADASVDEYYPALQAPTEIVEGYTLDGTTSTTAKDTKDTWTFGNGYSIQTGKGYSTGNNNTIKYSRNEKFTIVIPNGMAVEKVTFRGYDNYTDTDGYIYELGGTTYSTEDYVFPNDKSTVEHTITLATPKTGTLTFTPKGQQLCLAITLYVVNNLVSPSHVILKEFAYNYTPKADGPLTVTLQRPMGDYWNTLCVPFDIDAEQVAEVFGTGTQVAEFTAVEDGKLCFSTVDQVTAGTPCLVKPGNATAAYTFRDVTVKAVDPQQVTVGDYAYCGTYTTYSMATDGTQVGITKQNGLAVPAEATRVMRGLRAYFKVPKGTQANSVVVTDTETGMAQTVTVDDDEAPIYNMQGQRVNRPDRPGIYIQGHRKFIVR